MLSKQSLRSNISITINDQPTTKDELISLSSTWSENEEILFRKILKQGGNFKIQGKSYKIRVEEKSINSRGNLDAPIKPMEHTGDEIDPNYTRR